MKNPETSTVEPLMSKRPSKNEQRVYLDEELDRFLEGLQQAKGFKYRSEALRYCISQERARARRRAAEQISRQLRNRSPMDRQSTGTG